MDDEYAGICGITQEELETQMSADVDALGEKLGKSREETLAALREYYDGYHFADKSPDVFNPFMVLRTATHLYLFELKLNQNSDVAMKQIDLKEYPKRFALCGLPILKVGINFDVATHNITDWKVEENSNPT